MARIQRRPDLPTIETLTGDPATDVKILSEGLSRLTTTLSDLMKEYVKWDNLAPGVSTLAGDFQISQDVLATAAEGGFLIIPGTAGAPTGTPTDYNAGVPLVYDKTNNVLYVYDYTAAAWVDAGGVMKSQEFTASGTFTVPAGVTAVLVTAVGAGGGGSGSNTGSNVGGGGGGGEIIYRKPVVVVPGAAHTVTIGTAGAAGASPAGAGGNGTATTFGNLVSADFGRGGTTTTGGLGGGIYGGAAQTADAVGNNATELGPTIGGGSGGYTNSNTQRTGGKSISRGGDGQYAGGGGSWGVGGNQGSAAGYGGGGGSGNPAVSQAGQIAGGGYMIVEWVG